MAGRSSQPRSDGHSPAVSPLFFLGRAFRDAGTPTRPAPLLAPQNRADRWCGKHGSGGGLVEVLGLYEAKQKQ